MEIRVLVGLSGNEYSLSPGDQRDFPEKEAIRLIEAGFAVPVSEKRVEHAVRDAPAERRTKKDKSDVAKADDTKSDD